MPYITVTYPHELEEQLKIKKNAFVMFSASWCGPCRSVKPIFTKLADDAKYDCIHFIMIDIDDADQISNEYKIRSIPTFIMFVDGVPYERLQGVDPAKMQKLVDEILQAQK